MPASAESALTFASQVEMALEFNSTGGTAVERELLQEDTSAAAAAAAGREAGSVGLLLSQSLPIFFSFRTLQLFISIESSPESLVTVFCPRSTKAASDVSSEFKTTPPPHTN